MIFPFHKKPSQSNRNSNQQDAFFQQICYYRQHDLCLKPLLIFWRTKIFENISFQINKKERVGLVGRNGSGKTTLLKLLLGQLEADSGKIQTPKNYIIGHVQQHLHFTQATILEEVCLGLKPEDSHNSWKAEKIMTGLGFAPNEFNNSPHQYSGGYQIRLHLAKTLVAEPNMLLLDEPTNYLDIVSIRWLVGFCAMGRRTYYYYS